MEEDRTSTPPPFLSRSSLFDKMDEESSSSPLFNSINRGLFKRKDELLDFDEPESSLRKRSVNFVASPIPVKRTKQHSNFNPFVEPPSLLTVSTGCSPERSFLSEKDSSPSSKICKNLRTLSFLEVDEEQENKAHDPSTPPASSVVSAHFPKSAAKTLRFHHRSQTQDEKPGQSRFDSEFEVLGQLGDGSFGTVYKVKKRLDGCMYAVKMVRQSFHTTSGRERILKEVYALAASVNNSENPNVVRYFSSWIDIDNHLYIQTELCDMSLEALLLHEIPDSDIEHVACEILRQLLKGLKLLHSSNVVHLDIKPANILVKSGTYKLGDLGHVAMARVLPDPPPLPPSSSATLNDTMDIDGTTTPFDEEDERQRSAVFSVVQDVDEGDIRYMARELLNDDRDHLPKADIFSLAISIYEMFLKKSPPASGEDWAALREGHLAEEAKSKMSHDFRQLMYLMIHPDPARRPSADALLLTGGPGGVLLGVEALGHERLKREVEMLRGLHPSHSGLLKRANTM